MESNNKACVINASIGGWYPKGQERLKRSLITHGFHHDILTWLDWPNNQYSKDCIYNVKASAFDEAVHMGYTHILWLDSSVWALNNIESIFDEMNHEGYYLGMSGYNSAQSCSDKCLKYFSITRDEAENIPDTSTGILGLNLFNPKAKEFFNRWTQAAKDGIFTGSREHDNQSEDPRFLFHRQDQSAASIIANQLDMKLTPFGKYVSYYHKDIEKENVVLTLRGL